MDECWSGFPGERKVAIKGCQDLKGKRIRAEYEEKKSCSQGQLFLLPGGDFGSPK